MDDVVLANNFKFLFVHDPDPFQSMLMKITFALAVLCSSGSVPCSVAADDVKADHGDDIALLVEQLVKRMLKHGISNCLSRSLHECTLQ